MIKAFIETIIYGIILIVLLCIGMGSALAGTTQISPVSNGNQTVVMNDNFDSLQNGLNNLSGMVSSYSSISGYFSNNILGIMNGGTGSNTIVSDYGLPSQVGNSGKFLTTNGNISSWINSLSGSTYQDSVYANLWPITLYDFTTPVGVFTKYQEYTINKAGTYTIKFVIGNTDLGGARTHGQIFRNGVAVGTDQSVTNTFTEFSESIAGWSSGDLCQLYMYMDSGSGIVGTGGALRIYTDSTTPSIYSGTGVPNSTVGKVGDLYLRTDGSTSTTLYVKTGASTWTAK